MRERSKRTSVGALGGVSCPDASKADSCVDVGNRVVLGGEQDRSDPGIEGVPGKRRGDRAGHSVTPRRRDGSYRQHLRELAHRLVATDGDDTVG